MPLALLLITAAIAVGIFIYLAGPTVQDIQGTAPSPTASADPIDMRIDGIAFRIPAHYTESRASRSGGDQDKVDLHLLLPDLHPWQPTEAAEFASNLPEARVVHVVLKPNRQSMSEDQRFVRALKPQAIDAEGTPGPFGLTQFDFPPGSGYDDTQIFTAQLASGGLMVLRCDKVGNPNFGPSCIRDMRTPDGVNLIYRFKRAHLAEWQKIDTGVTGLVARFRADAPK